VERRDMIKFQYVDVVNHSKMLMFEVVLIKRERERTEEEKANVIFDRRIDFE
jgi:hypothetical protein